MNDSHLMGGVARQVISPDRGVFLAGYKYCNRGNTGIHDNLTATSLVLDDGEKKIAIIACDLLMINEEIVDQIRLELEPEICPIICCSQTHSGPIGFADFSSSPKQRKYVENLVKRIVAATGEAANNLEPIHLTWSQGKAKTAVQCFEVLQKKQDGKNPIDRNSSNLVDDSVQILNILKMNGDRMATLVNFAYPGKVLGAKNLLVSADWVGAMRSSVENDLGGLCLFLQGASGNLIPHQNKKQPDSWKRLQELGENIAQAVIESCREKVEPVHYIPVQLIKEEISLSFETPVTTSTPPSNDKKLLEIVRVPAFLSFFARFLLNWRLPWQVQLEETEGFWSIPMRMNAIRIGDLAILTFSANAFNEIGMEIKENSPSPHTMFVSAADGNIGILPTQKAIEEDVNFDNVTPLAYHLPGRLSSNCEEESLESAYRALDELWYVENLLNDHES